MGPRRGRHEDRGCDIHGVDEGHDEIGQEPSQIALMLVGNEENGEAEAWGTPHLLKELESEAVAIHRRRTHR